MDLTLGIRVVHVLAATFVVGIPTGLALVARARPDASVFERLVTPAERWIWASLALLVATGVGNLAAFDGAFPDGHWERMLLTKLGLVVVLLVVSAVRTFVIAGLASAPTARVDQLTAWYGATAALGLAIVALAEVLAHG